MTDSRCVTNDCGTTRWFNGKGDLHRLDGPAIVRSSGSMFWYVDGKAHRLNGPAIEWFNGDKEWYIDNKRLSPGRFERHPLVIFYRLCQESL